MGAGGTNGGIGRFLIGLIMMLVGGYLFFNAVHVSNHFQWGRSLYQVGGMGVSSGILLIPFIFGIGMVFFNGKNILGWLLIAASLILIFFGVITSLDFRFASMSLFSLFMILILFIGGIGLFLSSLKTLGAEEDPYKSGY